MTVKHGVAERKAVIAVLDAEHASMEEAADAVLKEAWALYERRARFAVVGRVRLLEHKLVEDNDDRAVRTLLDVYPTAKQAEDAALSMTFGPGYADGHETWVVPTFFGTSAAYYKQIKSTREDKTMATKSYFERELARRIAWVRDNPGKQLPADMRGVIPLIDPAELERRAA